MRAGQRAGQYSDYFLLDYFLLLRAGQRLDRERGLDRALSSPRPRAGQRGGLDRGEGWTAAEPGLDREVWTEAVQRLSRGLNSCLATLGVYRVYIS